MPIPFKQVDVFTSAPFRGNPVAVVMDATDLDSATMQRFAHWTNLSETTFLLPPTAPGADYRVRIFTPATELPFAGHPTIGTCHAWLEAGGTPHQPGRIVQECAAGLIELKHEGDRLAFAAPPLIRSGPVEPDTLRRALDALGLAEHEVVDSTWADNGPGWLALRLASVERLREIVPRFVELDLGIVAPSPAGSDTQWEVRAVFPIEGAMREDPVTGSLNASLAQWMLGTRIATAPYVAAQGAALGRDGRIHITQDGDTIWVGGDAVTCIDGSVEF